MISAGDTMRIKEQKFISVNRELEYAHIFYAIKVRKGQRSGINTIKLHT